MNMLKALKVVDKLKPKKDKKKRKGRPTCKKDEDEEAKKNKPFQNPKYKFINMQMEKLENMYVILSAEDGMSK